MRRAHCRTEVTDVMTHRTWLLAIAALAVSFTLGARIDAQPRPEAQLRAAIEAETVKGDLKAAIEQYRALATSADRRVAAQALVRMAGCHRKLGDAEARAIYERVLRDFGDQPEAVASARAGLRDIAPHGAGPTARGDRAVWTGRGVDMFGRVSPDGRSLTYVDWEHTGNLMLRDLSTNTSRALTTYPGAPYSAFAEYSTISADGTEVIYCWGTADQQREIRRLGLTSSAAKEPVRIYAGGKDVRFFGPLDWSRDKSLVATSLSKTDGTGQIVTIRIADGAMTVLRTVTWRGPDRLFLSPDARYLAYDLQSSESDGRRDVYVMDLATRREVTAVEHSANDGVLGWATDGRHLLFSSDRTGSKGIWAQAMAEGRPAGLPVMLRPDGAGLSLGSSSSGTLYVFRIVSSRDVHLADFDLTSGTLSRVRGFAQGFVDRSGMPSWSPDGRWLAYAACAERNCVVVRSSETGASRTLGGGLLFTRDPRWSPDGQRLLVAARDRQGRNGIFTIDVKTGAVSTVVLGPGFPSTPLWAADGTKIYYVHNGVIERTLATGAERTLMPDTGRGVLEISPDGRWLALIDAEGNQYSGPGRLVVIPTDGGNPRDALAVVAPESIGPTRTMSWAADSRSIVLARTTGASSALWDVPIDGRAPRKLDIDGTLFSKDSEGMLDQGFALSPDGRQVAFLSGRSAYEVWAIENLLPALDARR
jgi:Tol biopolymer transport system component